MEDAMGEESYELQLHVDAGLWQELKNGNFDLSLQDDLAKALGSKAKVTVTFEPNTKPGEAAEKDLAIIILASGFAIGLVGNAVTKVLRPWIAKRSGSSDATITPTFEDETTFSAKFPGGGFKISNKTKSK
jgi:hypothetical protein